MWMGLRIITFPEFSNTLAVNYLTVEYIKSCIMQISALILTSILSTTGPFWHGVCNVFNLLMKTSSGDFDTYGYLSKLDC